jgi:hypothetical protein
MKRNYIISKCNFTIVVVLNMDVQRRIRFNIFKKYLSKYKNNFLYIREHKRNSVYNLNDYYIVIVY